MQEHPAPDLKPVEGLWFPDADLILRAEHALFRVYSGILAARSAVFSDMVAFPQPALPHGLSIHGNPVVQLHDSAAEVEVFLRAIFDSNFFMPPPAPTDFANVIGVMRLAHKYDVQYLFRRALSHLDCVYPTTFLEFYTINTHGPPPHVAHPETLTAHLTVLRTAQEVGATWLLPLIYYYICSHPANELLAAGNLWDAMGVQSQQTCLMFQLRLSRATGLVHKFLNYLPCDACASPQVCADAVRDLQICLSVWCDAGEDLIPLGESALVSNQFHKLCKRCTKDGEDSHCGAQARFWGEMPEMLGLPSWEQLEKMRRDVLTGVE
ncbi:hypothetical protein C8R43DRAFT_692958 [Mycena crocata]|nr:hypothetical protein C8R43DRAFT_692958 [Mycena crocata]